MHAISPKPSVSRCNLVTGITGFAGCFLARALLDQGEDVVGFSLHGRWPAPWRQLEERIELYKGDLCDGKTIEDLLALKRPDRIFHLAGFARPGTSFREPDAAWAGNLTATRQLCEAVLRWGGRPRILFVGSGLLYGPASQPGVAVTEDTPLRPDTPYAASKAAADLACYQYTCSHGLDIVRARPFNHVGPLQSAEFAIANFARQIVAIQRGQMPPILTTGNLSSQRDLTDVRDMVNAYVLLAEHGRTSEAYNIGVGRTYSMQMVLDQLLSLAQLQVEVQQSPDLLRPTEPGSIRVDASKIRRETGWKPRYSLEETLWDILEAWRRS